MDSDRWKQVDSLLQAVLERPPEDRDAFLRNACAADEALEREVRSLLTAQRQSGSFLEGPAIEAAARALAQQQKNNDERKPDDSPIGQTISHYRVIGKLGAGGMGVVYEAEDIRLKRRVALKFLPDNLAHDPTALQRFKREAYAASSLNHPSICTIYEVEEHDEQPVIVMELLEGESLKERIRNGPVPADELLDLGTQISDALAAAHAKGIIHRDIKPANIFMAGPGRVKILDFGLAKAVPGHRPEIEPDEESLTAEGVIPGTTPYMSPEQVRGEEIDGRSDLFSLGVVLYEAATGKHPFIGKNRVLLMNAILNEKLVAPSRVNKELPPDMDAIIVKALVKDREQRYQQASEIRADLQAMKRGTDSAHVITSAKPVAATGVAKPWKAIVLAAVAVLAPAVGGYFYFHHTPKLTNKDTIVLADFTNTTGDAVFDGTLRQGLSVQLEQSPFLSIISDQQIQQTLQMVSRKPDAKLTPDIARELCQRTGSAAVLDGSIAQIGTPYLLTVKAVNCSNGETLASTEAQAGDKNHVLDALGKMAAEMRNKLGESLSTVEKFDTPLEEATTPSLEALKAFSSGKRATSPPLAITFYKRAVELDPNFAVAYAWLGVWHTSIGEPSTAAGYTRKAYELRDRASEPERYFVSAIYYKEVPGNLEKAEQTCRLWMQAYPRSEMPHTYLSGAIYPAMGRYDGVISEAREAIRLKPNYPVPYVFLMDGYMALNRFDEANSTYRQALERKLYHHYYPASLYHLAFLQNDAAGMKQQVTRSADQPGAEDILLAYEADTAAYYGRLRESEELTRRAMESAERADEKEISAGFSATSGLREALFGNAGEARRRASLAAARSSGVDVQYASALAMAYAGDTERAKGMTEELTKRFPEATTVQLNYLPTVRAKLALNRGNPSEALEMLRTALPYELGQTTFSGEYAWNGLYPVFVRGQAYLAAHQGGQAAAEFQKILDHRGIVWNSPIGALAHLQLGRAYALQGDTAKAKAAYQDFITLWKDADPDIPILKEAKAEYAKLQ
jgi:serine/threonine protein kinase/tetratricopeptide (TPR) repeat protein